MLNWLPSYVVRERGLSIAEMATLTGSAYVVTAVSALLAGWVIDRLVSRYDMANLAYKSVMVVAHAGSVACMLCIALGPPNWAIPGIFAYQLMNGIASPGVFAMSHILAGPTAAGPPGTTSTTRSPVAAPALSRSGEGNGAGTLTRPR